MVSPWTWLTDRVGTHRHDSRAEGSGEDVALDPALASSRATGGDHNELSGDRGSTAGTGRTDEFVGRVAGDDLRYAGETGAERRAEALRNDETATAGPAEDGK
jgi:hypothetical protein